MSCCRSSCTSTTHYLLYTSSHKFYKSIIMHSTISQRTSLAVWLLAASLSDAFVAPRVSSRQQSTPKPDSSHSSKRLHQTTILHAGSSNGLSTTTDTSASNSLSRAEEFALQELRAQLVPESVLSNAPLLPSALAPAKRTQVFQYAETLANSRAATMNVSPDLIGSSWVLCASVDNGQQTSDSAAALPKGATIRIDVTSADTLTYSLVFAGAAAGLEQIAAKCSYETNDVNELTMIYQSVSFDAFKIIKQFPIGMFGLLQGRSNVMATAYMDESIWIENAGAASGGASYNVYVRLPTKQ
ncbi:hypothetical protein MPSEU_000874900 [Mayamaea pseudoterrestris]|nr:hypothetical protein MPSEU_000874900 [Mayamaea pseudoterrestris]